MLATCVYASFVYFGHLPWLAFGNEVARMISLCSIIEKQLVPPLFPITNRQSLGLFWRPHIHRPIKPIPP